MARELKVYGWQGYNRDAPGTHNQVRWLIAAHSKAEVRRVTGARESDLFNFGETANDSDCEHVLAQPPLTLMWRPLDHAREYHVVAESPWEAFK